ncbi:hypothetical protein [uncultured Arthrobacter sp.]|uniref:hypothetical protein n=1 Tax=uncultured Arthrobacter sp. TaxID=114050 RepID=UPI002637877A|nr:hypothetical protein [uncultured Arthrobacter sp.]
MKAAVPIIVAGLVLLLLGIGVRTVSMPAETRTISTIGDTRAAPVTVIMPEVRGDQGGDLEVTVEGDGPFTLAVGRSSDVEAWVGEAARVSITGTVGDTLAAHYTEGEPTVPDPAGSDLWVSETSATGRASYRWSEPVEGDWSIVLATGGGVPAPTDVSVTLPNDRSTPLALPLLVGGALVVVLGLVVLFSAPRGRRGRRAATQDRAGSTADEQRQDAPGSSGGVSASSAPRSATLVIGLAGAGSLLVAAPGLALAPGVDTTATATATATAASTASATSTAPATAADEPPLATGAPSPGSAASGPPVVLDSQLERILAAVATTVADADAAADPERLAPRVDGAARDLRVATYEVGAQDATAAPPVPVAAAPVLLEMIPTGVQWPRTLAVLTQGAGNPVPQALVLEQESARENYRLVTAVQMLPEVIFPTPPPPGATGPIPLDEPGALTLAPQEAVAALAGVLSNPSARREGVFEEETLAGAITGLQAGISDAPASSGATVSSSHAAQDQQTRALPTGDGGAMVFGYLTQTSSRVPTSAAGRIDLDGTVYESLTGEATSRTGIDVIRGEAVMMYVPPAGSADAVRVVGVAQQLLSAELR